MTSIAIVGGGFSGVCTAIHLIIHANQPIAIYLIEQQPHLGRGIAYGTSSSYHPLNVCASRMGLFADQPQHFYSWLESHPELWRHLDPSFHSLTITPDSFLPRKIYAIYLENMLNDIQALALKKNILFQFIQSKVQDANVNQGKIEVILENSSLFLDHLVLAVGVPSNQQLPFENASLLNHTSYVSNIWESHVEKNLHDRFAGNKGIGKRIIIIGSGLTSIDALFTLHSIHYQGSCHFISKHGIFPKAHAEHFLPILPPFKTTDLPTHLSEMILFFREKLEHDVNLDWRQLLDAFRPCTQALWQSFPLLIKKQFMRHLLFLWNKHRHRMSPQSYHLLRLYENSSALKLTAGIIQHIISLQNEKLQIKYFDKEKNQLCEEEVDCVMNCTGPNYRIQHHPDKLIQQLLKKQVILPDEMGLGLKLIHKQRLVGKAEGRIHALGALLFGELLETVAVPEIREQAASIAKTILSSAY